VGGATKGTIYINAPNIHRGGGAALLRALLHSEFDGPKVCVVVDSRFELPKTLRPGLTVRRVRPSIWSRTMSDVWLARSSNKDDVVLCFGNLPPLCRLKAWTAVFIQNRYLVDRASLSKFDLRTRTRLTVERLWLKHLARFADRFVVQSETMRRLVMDAGLSEHASVSVLPFLPPPTVRNKEHRPEKRVTDEATFLYVASAEPHKNHRKLIEAWCLLAAEGMRPRLCLTLEESEFLKIMDIEVRPTKAFACDIINLGILGPTELLKKYSEVTALVYPSIVESFGMPLLEAMAAGLPILAGELDYVRDVVQPSETFDPNSAVSISRAVKRFLGAESVPPEVRSPEQFLHQIWQHGQRSSS